MLLGTISVELEIFKWICWCVLMFVQQSCIEFGLVVCEGIQSKPVVLGYNVFYSWLGGICTATVSNVLLANARIEISIMIPVSIYKLVLQ